MDFENSIKRLGEIQKEIHAYTHAIGLLGLDANTAAPEKSAAGRGETLAVLCAAQYELISGSELHDIIYFLRDCPEKLTHEQKREVELLIEQYEITACIPQEEYVEYTKVINEAEAVWHTAKLANDYASFAPLLEKIVNFQRKFALYYKPAQDPYETLLGEYEKGTDTKQLDKFFGLLREKLVPVIHAIGKAAPIDDSMLHGTFPIEQQRKLSDRLMQVMTIDPKRCTLAETLHPFTTEFGVDDVRITTFYDESDFSSSMFSVIHEGGHALYELGGNPLYDGTVLAGGTSLGVHESQSRFFENIIGRSREFCTYILPDVKKLFPQLESVGAEDFYRAINISHPSLIRTLADELTYPLHIMVRYELEKRMIAGTLGVNELPAEWNRMYKEYLGVDVPDDAHGVLQDSHWSSGLIGYFPSYALGSAYGAQFLLEMQKEVDVFGCAAKGELGPIVKWLNQNIHIYSSLYDPADIVRMACRGEFDPSYYVDYLTKKYSELYSL